MFDFELMRRASAAVAMSEAEAAAARSYREPDDGIAFEALGEAHPVPALTDAEIAALVSQETKLLVVEFEVTSQRHYEKKLVVPEWPGGESGITIGIGYDVGYHTEAELVAHWDGLLPPEDIEKLKAAVSRKGQAAKAMLGNYGSIRVPWDAAMQAFTRSTMPKYGRLVLATFPNAHELAGHCFGALFSLVFNRGAKLGGARRTEMRAIRDLMQARNYDAIPQEFRKMKRLWADAGLSGLLKRREAEALLFERGLELRRAVAVASADGVVNESLQDESRFDGDGLSFDDTEEASGVTFEKVGPAVSWPVDDDDAPDYHHVPATERTLTGAAFEFGARELELLIAANSFNPTRDLGRIVFALRGAELVSSLTSATVVAKQLDRPALTLRDTRPNHRDLKCVIGVYDTTTGRLSGFASSTVPNVKAVQSYYTNRSSGNMTPTGCYRFEVGWHLASKPERKVPGCLIERGRRKAVLRTTNNLSYDLDDPWHNERDTGNNLHPAFGGASQKFSSFGCLVVNGSFVASGDRAKGIHKGEWAEFRAALGLAPSGTSDHGKEYDVVLLTGLEAAIAHRLVSNGEGLESKTAFASLVRLRQGSRGDAVKRLQAFLALPETGVLDHRTAKALADRQKSLLAGKSDGVYSPQLDASLNLAILERTAPVAVAMAKQGVTLEGAGGSLGQAREPDHARLEQLYYEIGLAVEASRRNPGTGGVALESLDGAVLERISFDLGMSGFKALGASVARSVELQLREAICGGTIDQAVDRNAIRSKVDAAASQGVTELRNYLSTLLSALTLLPRSAADKVVEVLFERFIVPATAGIGDKVTEKMDLSASWLCEQWQRSMADRGIMAEPVPTQPPADPHPHALAAPHSALVAMPSAQPPANPTSKSDPAAILDRLEQVAVATDTAGARMYIKELREEASRPLTPDESERLLKLICDTKLIDHLGGSVGPDPYELVNELVTLTSSPPLDRKAISSRVQDLRTLLTDARIKLGKDAVTKALKALKSIKAFNELSLLSDRVLARDPSLKGLVVTLYAQGLIDSGRIMAGIDVLASAIQSGAIEPSDEAEAYGILGRGYKQRYVDHVRTPGDALALADEFGPILRKAIQSYAACWDPARPGENSYPGINYIALLARAERDGIKVPAQGNSKDLASAMVAALEASGAQESHWVLATLGEACLAAGDLDKAADYYSRYARHPQVDAFALNSTVRQLEEVWQLKASAKGQGAIVTGLKTVLASMENGHVTLAPEDVRAIGNAETVEFQHVFETYLPGGRHISYAMLRNIVICGRAVAAVQLPNGLSARTQGTGFLIRGEDLAPGLLSPEKSYVLTNAHVVWDPELGPDIERDALPPDRVQLVFESDLIEGRREIYRCKVVWQSPSSLHDAVVMELDRKVDHIPPVKVAPPTTRLKVDVGSNSTRLAVLGHPKGGDLSVSVHGGLEEKEGTLLDMGPKGKEPDPVFLHYKTPTEGGNSGSPVFEVLDAQDWHVVALHHAGFNGEGLLRLGGKSGWHKANEGICIQSIRRAATAELRAKQEMAAKTTKPSRGLFGRRKTT